MPGFRKKPFNNVCCPDFHAGCAYAWMAAQVFLFLDILVDQQLHFMVPVIYSTILQIVYSDKQLYFEAYFYYGSCKSNSGN
jgi:hypothetical protein